MKKSVYFLLIWAVVLAASCKQPNLTPAYIEITAEDINNCVDVSNYNDMHGVNYDAEQLMAFQQHTFTHVNVYVNGKNLGCWEVPCKIPVLDMNGTDSASVIILPAFRMTGMSNTVMGYPFFDVLMKKLLLKPGETYQISTDPLSFRYSSYATCPYLETFINSSSFTALDSTHNITFIPQQHDGRSVGAISMTTDDYFDVATPYVTLPARNYFVFLEVTYKIDSNVDVGLKLSTAQHPNTIHPLGGIYATDGEWKTIYFNLANVISSYHYTGGSWTTASIVLTGIGEKDKNVNFYIDNIKILYEPSV